MSRLFITLLLLATVFGGKLSWSSINSPISSPANSKGVYVDFFNNHPTYKDVIPGVKWIWDNDGKNTPKGDIMEVEHKFWAKCEEELTLTIAAYDKWWVWFDGDLVKSGDTWKEAAEIEFEDV